MARAVFKTVAEFTLYLRMLTKEIAQNIAIMYIDRRDIL